MRARPATGVHRASRAPGVWGSIRKRAGLRRIGRRGASGREERLEGVVVLGVEAADALEPEAGEAEAVGQEAAERGAADAGLADETGLGEDLQVLRDRGEGHGVRGRDVADGSVAREQRGQDGAAGRVGQGCEDLVEVRRHTMVLGGARMIVNRRVEGEISKRIKRLVWSDLY